MTCVCEFESVIEISEIQLLVVAGMNKVYCCRYRYQLLWLSISQTAVSAEPASSTGKPITGCTDRLCHTVLILNIIVGSLLIPGTSACHVTRCLCHQTLSERVVYSRLT